MSVPTYVLSGFGITAGGFEATDVELRTANGVTSFSYTYLTNDDASILADIAGNFSLFYDGTEVNPEDQNLAIGRLKWGAGLVTNYLFVENDDAFFLAPISGDTGPQFHRDNGNVFGEFGDLVTGGGNVKSGPFAPNKTISLSDFFSADLDGVVKYGSGGKDKMGGTKNADVLVGLKGADVLNGKGGADTLMLGRSDDKGYGGSGGDVITGYIGDDLIYGGTGGDRLIGGSDNDKLWGQKGGDKLLGGNGADRLDGGAGDDTLTGGKKADRFVFSEGGDNDKINDFRNGSDRLLLNDNLWNGDMTKAEVVEEFATKSGGKITMDFGGGDVLVLRSYGDLDQLAGFIDII